MLQVYKSQQQITSGKYANRILCYITQVNDIKDDSNASESCFQRIQVIILSTIQKQLFNVFFR